MAIFHAIELFSFFILALFCYFYTIMKFNAYLKPYRLQYFQTKLSSLYNVQIYIM
jgi:hypothetical protein